jgi:hypothetical protein
LIRASDRQILHRFALPVTLSQNRYAAPHFVDDSRFVILGDFAQVEDSAGYAVLERQGSLPGSETVAISPDGRRAWIGDLGHHSISVLELESADCSPPGSGLAMFFPADGTNEDSTAGGVLTSQGNLQFTPGRVGQSFLLDGTNSLSTDWIGHFQDGAREMSLALYVKFADLAGEAVLIDWVGENPLRGFSLVKGVDNHLLLRSWPGGETLQSRTIMAAGTWYHLVLTRTDGDVALYVNGEADARGSSPPQLAPRIEGLFFGARASGRPSFRGQMDEILGYNRAMTDSEVKALYRMRETGPCRI